MEQKNSFDIDLPEEVKVVEEKKISKIKEFLFNKGFGGLNNFLWIFFLFISSYQEFNYYKDNVNEEKITNYLDTKNNKNIETYNQYHVTEDSIASLQKEDKIIDSLFENLRKKHGLEQNRLIELRNKNRTAKESMNNQLEEIKDRALEEIEFYKNYKKEEKNDTKNKNLPEKSGNCAGC